MIGQFAAASANATEGSGAGATRGLPFAGRLAVVTGAGHGIGRTTALAFAERGARVVVCDVDLEAAQRTAELAGLLGPAGHAYRVDVSDGPAMDAFAAEVSDTHGVPDIMVNNAGIGHAGTFLATTEKEWQRVLDVNLWGVIHGCRVFGSRMADGGAGGHIVNVASAAAYLPSKDLAAYATSKSAPASSTPTSPGPRPSPACRKRKRPIVATGRRGCMPAAITRRRRWPSGSSTRSCATALWSRSLRRPERDG
jgi:hypothetical protein